MKIYIDSDFRCHITGGVGMQSVETDYFDGKCTEFIEGYQFIPEGESWTSKDGTVFRGEMVAPAEDYALLQRFQAQHEADMAASKDMAEALAILGVTE